MPFMIAIAHLTSQYIQLHFWLALGPNYQLIQGIHDILAIFCFNHVMPIEKVPLAQAARQPY